jgi:hypothetical protein
MQLDSGQINLTNTTDWLSKSWKSYTAAVSSPNPAHDLYPQALIDITLLATRFSDEDIIPETLKMDSTRVVSFFNSWQDITILATIMIVFRQAAGPKCSIPELEQVKKDLWILLNDNESTMEHITIQMAHSAGKIRGKPLSSQETTGMSTVTDNALAPGSKLYELIQKRVGIHLQQGLSKLALRKVDLEKHGLTQVVTEIEELIKKFVPVSDLNRAVYGGLYGAIIEDIKDGIPAESPRTKKFLEAITE